jgi:brefeldin A-resistance guanine nucleotide exchange factor 1
VTLQALGPGIDSPAPSIRDFDSPSIKENRRHILEATQLSGDMMSSRTTPVSVAVDPVALITTECITVTSAMRKHARWAHSSVSAILGGSSSPMNPSMQSSRPSTPRDDLGQRKGHRTRSSSGLGGDGFDDGGLANRWGLRGKKGKSMQDNPLMAGFGRLRRELTGCKGNSKPLLGSYILI